MANKEVLDQINAERIRRTLTLLWADGGDNSPIIDRLVSIVESWLREADLLSRSQKKGWQTEAKTLGSAVVLLKLEIAALEKRAASRPSAPAEPVTGPTPSWTDPAALDALVADSKAEGRGELIAGDIPCASFYLARPHEPHTWIGAMNGRYRCAGLAPVDHDLIHRCSNCHREVDSSHPYGCCGACELASADLSSQLAREASKTARTALREVETPPSFDLRPMSGDEALSDDTESGRRAILDGIIDADLAAYRVNHPGSPSVRTAVMERLGVNLEEMQAHQQIDQEYADVHADPIVLAGLLDEMSAPEGPPSRVPPPGAHLRPHTWAELAQPADPATIPDHLSPSQLSALDLCAAQARIGRYEDNPSIPLWGAVGGSAFHAAVEEIERKVATGTAMVEYVSYPEVLMRMWEQHFLLTVSRTAIDSGVPMAQWHASNRGKENYSWWQVEGGEMLRRYVTYRATHDDGRKVLVLPDGRPAIELELNLSIWDPGHTVDPLPVKVIIDIVWQLPDGSLEIWDHKTRQDFMGPIVDTIQLGTQGHALDQAMAALWYPDAHWKAGTLGQITARYFDARKGTLTEAFDPLDKHPMEELEMRYADADDKRRNRPAIPVRSNLCKACPVAYLCPVGSKP